MVFLAMLTGGITRAQVSNTGVAAINAATVVGFVSDFNNQETGTLWNDGELYVFSNFNNDGLVSFTPNERGTTRFEGLSKQNITGSVPIEFNHVLFNNNSTEPIIDLYGEISVAGNANFSHGIVSNEFAGGTMVFEKEATHSNTNDASYVDGNIKRNGENEFIYPVGHKNRYRNSAIQATSDVLSSFTSNYFNENSDAIYPHAKKAGVIEAINDQEYWTLEKNNGNADAILTLSWDETNTTPEHIVVFPEEDIHIVGWDSTENLWIDKGGIVDVANKTVTAPISIFNYTIYTLARVKSSTIIEPCNSLVIYNAISPNGDGMNDFFRIDGLETCSKGSNTVQIFNRWGVKVFETKNYGVNGNVFKGYSGGRTTIANGNLLPSGTYFYVLDLNTDLGTTKKSGYLYLN